MDRLLANLKINIPTSVYIKDPESSDLGKRIIEHSICLIDEVGIEAFTFKKLGGKLVSNLSPAVDSQNVLVHEGGATLNSEICQRQPRLRNLTPHKHSSPHNSSQRQLSPGFRLSKIPGK